eukprot:6174334-Pleurochrysis_carterae.AAC.6
MSSGTSDWTPRQEAERQAGCGSAKTPASGTSNRAKTHFDGTERAPIYAPTRANCSSLEGKCKCEHSELKCAKRTRVHSQLLRGAVNCSTRARTCKMDAKAYERAFNECIAACGRYCAIRILSWGGMHMLRRDRLARRLVQPLRALQRADADTERGC